MADEKKGELPNNHVLAVVSGAAAAGTAVRDLESNGYDSVTVLKGEDLTSMVDAKGERSGPLASLFRAVEDHFSEEMNYLAQYQEEARQGKEIVAVAVPDAEAARTARDVLLRHGAHNIRFFGKLAVHDLTPQNNPSTRSAESPDKWSNT